MTSNLYAATVAGQRDDALEAFLSWTTEQGFNLYLSQEEALLEVFAASTSSSTLRPAQARALSH